MTLKNMNYKNIEKVLSGEPKFRLKQAKKLIFQDLISDWKEASVFSAVLRDKLNKECPLLVKGDFFVSKNKDSVKALIELEDGLKVESVLMQHKDRNTICVSSQVGCPLGCKFCATGINGYKRDLTYSEIVAQAVFFARFLKKENRKITNIVFMGMGEPFLNYDNVLKAIKILNDPEGFNLGARRMSISTVGIIEGINKLAKENLQVNLAISLHASNDDLRTQIMPINKKYPLNKILNAVDKYIEATGRKVMFEYIMIKDFNDSVGSAEELAKFMKKHLYLVNLINYNPTGIFTPADSSNIKEFKDVLEEKGVKVTERYRLGSDIEAACGQLAGKGAK